MSLRGPSLMCRGNPYSCHANQLLYARKRSGLPRRTFGAPRNDILWCAAIFHRRKRHGVCGVQIPSVSHSADTSPCIFKGRHRRSCIFKGRRGRSCTLGGREVVLHFKSGGVGGFSFRLFDFSPFGRKNARPIYGRAFFLFCGIPRFTARCGRTA